MSANVLMLPPVKNSYAEVRIMPTSMLTFDNGGLSFLSQSDLFDNADEYAKLKIKMNLKTFTEKQFNILNSLLYEGVSSTIKVPVYFSQMNLSSAFTSGTTVNVKASSYCSNITYSEFYGYRYGLGITVPRPNVELLLVKQDEPGDVPEFEVFTISSINHGASTITTSGSPTVSFAENDHVYPLITCTLSNSVSFEAGNPAFLNVGIEVVEI